MKNILLSSVILLLLSCGKHLLPTKESDYIQIAATCKCDSKEQAEKTIAIPLEEALKQQPGLDRLNTIITKDSITIDAYLQPGVDRFKAKNSVDLQVSDILDELDPALGIKYQTTVRKSQNTNPKLQ